MFLAVFTLFCPSSTQTLDVTFVPSCLSPCRLSSKLSLVNPFIPWSKRLPRGKNFTRTKDKGVSQSLELKKASYHFRKLQQVHTSLAMRVKFLYISLGSILLPSSQLLSKKEKSSTKACSWTLIRLRWFRMVKKAHRVQGVWRLTAYRAPCDKWRPRMVYLSNKAHFMLVGKKDQKGLLCKKELIKVRCWKFNSHLKPMEFQ